MYLLSHRFCTVDQHLVENIWSRSLVSRPPSPQGNAGKIPPPQDWKTETVIFLKMENANWNESKIERWDLNVSFHSQFVTFNLSTYFNFQFPIFNSWPLLPGFNFQRPAQISKLWRFSRIEKLKAETLKIEICRKLKKLKIENWNSGSWLAGCWRAGWVAGRGGGGGGGGPGGSPLPASSIRIRNNGM